MKSKIHEYQKNNVKIVSKKIVLIALVAVAGVAVSCNKESNLKTSSNEKRSEIVKVDFSKSLKVNQSYGIGGQNGVIPPPLPKP